MTRCAAKLSVPHQAVELLVNNCKQLGYEPLLQAMPRQDLSRVAALQAAVMLAMEAVATAQPAGGGGEPRERVFGGGKEETKPQAAVCRLERVGATAKAGAAAANPRWARSKPDRRRRWVAAQLGGRVWHSRRRGAGRNSEARRRRRSRKAGRWS